jgi:paraquat-inducible protein B
MAEVPGTQGRPLAEPQTRGGFSISAIWLLPMVALAIGGWLVYQTISQKGPVITIAFESGDGIEATKTKVKFRDVEVGVVESIGFKEDLSGVVVTVEMLKGAAPYLTSTTRFWVVQPRLGISGISGLGTLVSGVFIEIDPGEGGEARRDFAGLKVPPVIKSNSPGREFILKTTKLGSYGRGSPVYYRGISVGEVQGYDMSADGREITVHIFVHAPYHENVRENSRFWNISGIEVSMDADGMRIKAESLQSLVQGGITFDTPDSLFEGAPSKEGDVFTLYETQEDIEKSRFVQSFPWVLYFSGSVRGLSPGAPVEFKGIKIGEVKDVRLEIDLETKATRIPVLIEIEPQRASFANDDPGRVINLEEHRKGIRALIEKGLRARMKTGNLLTGALLIDLGLHPDTEAKYLGTDEGLPEIPTIPSSIEEITGSITAVLNKVEALPLEDLTTSMTGAIKSADRLLNSKEILSTVRSLDQAMVAVNKVLQNVDANLADLSPPALSALKEANLTLKAVREAVVPDSPLRYDLETTLQELAAAARSIRLLAEYLESNPNALIYGKSGRPPE